MHRDLPSHIGGGAAQPLKMEEYENLNVEAIASSATLSGVVCTPSGDIYVTDASKVLFVDLDAGKLVLYAGGGHIAANASARLSFRFETLHGIGAGPDNALYPVCTSTHKIFCIKDDLVTVFAGTEKGSADGPRLEAQFNCPQRIVELKGCFYVADCWNHAIRKISETGQVTTIGTGTNDFITGDLLTCSTPYTRGLSNGPGNSLLVSASGPHRVSKIDFDSKTLVEIAGSGKGFVNNASCSAAQFDFPFDLTFNPKNGDIFVADDDNQSIRLINVATNTVSCFVGSGPGGAKNGSVTGPRLEVRIGAPTGIHMSTKGDLIWTSRDHYLRFIRGVGPDLSIKKIRLPSFTAYLDDPKYAEHQVTLKSGKTFNLVPQVFELWDLSIPDFKRFIQEKSDHVPEEAIETFLSLIYGQEMAKVDLSEEEHLRLLSYVWYISHEFFHDRSDNSISASCLNRLRTELEGLNTKGLLDFATLNGKHLFSVMPHARTLWQVIMYSRYTGDQVEVLMAAGDDEYLNSLIDRLSQLQVAPPVDPSVANLRDPLASLDKTLESLARRLEKSSAKPSTDLAGLVIPETDFSLTIEGSPMRFQCHSFILYARWKYFQAMIDAGFKEAQAMRAELPSEILPQTLSVLLRFIYTGCVTQDIKDTLDLTKASVAQLLDIAPQYRIVDVDDEDSTVMKPMDGFGPLISYLKLLQSGQSSGDA